MQIQTNNQADTPITALKALINDFLARHSRVTVQALAQRANVPVTSLRRLMQEESKTEVAPHTALNLCAYICREKRIGKLLEMLPLVLAEYLEKHFGGFVFEGSEKRVYATDLNEVLKDRMSYFIYKLAANRCGTSWMEITELFGSTGKRKAEELKRQELLIEENDRLIARDRDFSLDLQVATSHLPELVKFYRPENVGRGLNLMYSLSESLNEAAIKKIKDIQRDAVKATHAIMQSPESAGEISYFTLNLCETFLTETEGSIQ